ncbi:ABC transporter substrate-binding protein [Mesorhizobium qingshengii]|uniref:Spermidine/putrescine transport system substrate-binding protein n=1 Tax=Mesorhizobium qingshengii TaxID=1165689 RepID=A0A1G5ZVK3_9HYPH|nr:extracellular solute-binding protein [Mesorhizobium qingshengii]SDA98692.1 spermidine/putrescine transport system substrate-binding protein [Mesorhizobium qingshengii]
MTQKRTNSGMSRRTVLKAVAAGAAFLGAPAIIGRALVTSAKAAFEGESLIAVSWSGNYEQVFRETVIDPFNAHYNTKAETVGGWDQIVSQIKAAPADNPPFDVSVGEEYISSAGLAEGLYQKTDATKIPNLKAVYPWFYETRPDRAKDYGIPFGGGTCMLLARKALGIDPTSWALLWDQRLAGKVTADSAAWWWTLSVPAVMDKTSPGLDEMYAMTTAESLFAKLDQLKIAKWFKDGAEQANILNQGDADAAMSYSSDAYTFLTQSPDEYVVKVPAEGTSAWTDWYFKVRGTRHADLADLFMNYMLEKETQDRFLSKSLIFMARKDVTVPPQWNNYPAANEDFHRMFQLITMDGWDKINADYQAYDDRMKQTIARTTG